MQNGKYVVLTIDDDPDNCQAVRTILEGSGYMVYEAHSAEDGLKMYKKVNPDLLLVDLIMEEVDSGLRYAKELKLLNNKAPIYLLSGVGDTVCDSTACDSVGFDGVFQKPIDPDRLLKVLKAKLK